MQSCDRLEGIFGEYGRRLSLRKPMSGGSNQIAHFLVGSQTLKVQDKCECFIDGVHLVWIEASC